MMTNQLNGDMGKERLNEEHRTINVTGVIVR
jgi:hypothetical protein